MGLVKITHCYQQFNVVSLRYVSQLLGADSALRGCNIPLEDTCRSQDEAEVSELNKVLQFPRGMLFDNEVQRITGHG